MNWTTLCEGIVGYIESLRGSASKEVDADIYSSISKAEDTAILVVGFFSDASDTAFQIYDEASKILLHFYVPSFLL